MATQQGCYCVAMMLNKTTVASLAWTIAVIVVALITDIQSLKGWLTVGLFALVPPAILMHFGKPVPLTTSEAISQARR
jgi:hypothetical protein